MRCQWGAAVRALVLVVFMIVVSAVAAGSAVASEPTGEFAIFKECPRFTSGVDLCIYARTVGGSITLGKRTVRIETPVTLQGGIDRDEETGVETIVAALNGETVSRTPQRIPGGLFGLPLYATIELAGPASEVEVSKRNLLIEEGPGLSLPVRVRLESPLLPLGGECYIGSRARPIVLTLTTGRTSPSPPNVPISGTIGPIGARDEFNLIEIPGVGLVENAFSVPAATGCGSATSSLLDVLVDNDVGLPSPDGRNSVIEDDTIWEASTNGVIGSEK